MATTIYGKRRGHLFVAEWMEHRELSDEKLANRLGVDRVTVTRWRNQQHRLNPDKIAAIAVALDVDCAQLFRPPPPTAPPSIDALLRDAPTELQDTAADIVKRLVSHR
jgi:transcriptional regulator with XRE-family HTH domain